MKLKLNPLLRLKLMLLSIPKNRMVDMLLIRMKSLAFRGMRMS